jgi:hypothetical protein
MDFEQKYDDALNRINILLNDNYTPKNLKKYIEGYKLEQSIDVRNKKKLEESFINQNYNNNSYMFDEKRKRQVTLTEIKEHEQRFDRIKAQNIINNEIKRKKMKEQENEYLNKIEREYNIKRYSPLKTDDDMKTNIINNNIKRREFSKIANKINIEKLKERNKKRTLDLDVNNINSKSNQDLRNKKIKSSSSEITQRNKLDNSKYKKLKQKIRNFSVKQRARPLIIDNRYNVDKRIPLQIRPDYLRQKDKIFNTPRQKIYQKQFISNSKDQYLNHINELKIKAENYETQAKREEQLMKLRNSNNFEYDTVNKVSSLLYDSISTKFALLNQIQRDMNTKKNK